MVDPGHHLFRFESRGFVPTEQKQMLAKGERNRTVDVRLKTSTEEAIARADSAPSETSNVEPRPDRARSAEVRGGIGAGRRHLRSGWSWACRPVELCLFRIERNHDASNLRSQCAPNCSDEQVNAARSKLIVANVSLGVGIAAIGVGAILWAVQDSRPPRKGRARTAFGSAISPSTCARSPRERRRAGDHLHHAVKFRGGGHVQRDVVQHPKPSTLV